MGEDSLDYLSMQWDPEAELYGVIETHASALSWDVYCDREMWNAKWATPLIRSRSVRTGSDEQGLQYRSRTQPRV